MDKRFQVFVSSTFLDLREERQEVIHALLELDGIPAAMELWPSTSDDSWTLIQRVIRQSDYYLVVIGGKYGSVDNEGISYTEREYDYAVDQGKPVMAFVHADTGSLISARVDLDPLKRSGLEKFRQKVMAGRFCRQWTSAKELGGQVSRSFAVIKNSHPAPGWVSAKDAIDPSTMVELSRARERIRELEAEMERTRRSAPPEASGYAQGADKTMVRFGFTARPSSGGDPKKHGFESAVSWDEIFAAIGPRMLEPLREDSFLREMARMLARAEIRRQRIESFSEDFIWEDDFHRIKLQLRAIGLIEKAARPHDDKHNTWWQLTSFGDAYLTSLLAERRSAKYLAGNGD